MYIYIFLLYAASGILWLCAEIYKRRSEVELSRKNIFDGYVAKSKTVMDNMDSPDVFDVDEMVRMQSSTWFRQLYRKTRRRSLIMRRISMNLRQAGFFTSGAQSAFLFSRIFIFISCLLVSIAVFQWSFSNIKDVFVYSSITMLLIFVLMLKGINDRGKARKRRLDEQSITLVQLTRMYWTTGMTVESMLRHLIKSLHKICPDASAELWVAYQRIQSGQDRVEALEDLSKIQRSRNFSSYINMVAQVSVSGGKLDASLQELEQLLVMYRKVELQAQVSRLSGKISLVMMVFLFPALLIILAGPAVINIGGILTLIGS